MLEVTVQRETEKLDWHGRKKCCALHSQMPVVWDPKFTPFYPCPGVTNWRSPKACGYHVQNQCLSKSTFEGVDCHGTEHEAPLFAMTGSLGQRCRRRATWHQKWTCPTCPCTPKILMRQIMSRRRLVRLETLFLGEQLGPWRVKPESVPMPGGANDRTSNCQGGGRTTCNGRRGRRPEAPWHRIVGWPTGYVVSIAVFCQISMSTPPSVTGKTWGGSPNCSAKCSRYKSMPMRICTIPSRLDIDGLLCRCVNAKVIGVSGFAVAIPQNLATQVYPSEIGLWDLWHRHEVPGKPDQIRSCNMMQPIVFVPLPQVEWLMYVDVYWCYSVTLCQRCN